MSSPVTAQVTAKAVRITPHPRPLKGAARPPGSKSITNRALLLAALAKGTSRLTGALKSDDTRHMAEALRKMGVMVEEPAEDAFTVTGDGRLKAPSEPLFIGNAGTAIRFLAAASALADGPVTLDGDEHMRKRPIGPLIEALRRMGIGADAQDDRFPPVTIHGKGDRYRGGRVTIDAGLSSQYVSALLMLGACGQVVSEVALSGSAIGARGYVDLTLEAMRAFGARAEPNHDHSAWRIAPGGYRATDFEIEPDASAATYLWAAQALTNGRIDLGYPTADFTQPDAAAAKLIARFPHMPPVIEGSQMQDAVPTLAVLAAFNERPVRFTGIANLRVKECDRISAVATELNRIRPGLAREDGDELVVEGDPGLAGQTLPARIETYADHRIAMSFALMGLLIDGIVILDPGCTAKTWPAYWAVLESLGVGLDWEA
jgi:3-phosphoshikimate 1-carboxyvinyltransferase